MQLLTISCGYKLRLGARGRRDVNIGKIGFPVDLKAKINHGKRINKQDKINKQKYITDFLNDIFCL